MCLSCICLLAMHTLICVTFSLPLGVRGWLRLLLVALARLFCLPFIIQGLPGHISFAAILSLLLIQEGHLSVVELVLLNHLVLSLPTNSASRLTDRHYITEILLVRRKNLTKLINFRLLRRAKNLIMFATQYAEKNMSKLE